MIGVLAPYREIADIVADLQREIQEPLEVLPVRLTDALGLSLQLVKSGATVIVSRGGITEHLRASKAEWLSGVPIVDIPVTAYDVIKALRDAKKKAEWVSLVAFPNIIECVQGVAELLGPKVLLSPIGARSNLHKIMRQQAHSRDICFVGEATTCEVAEACGLRYVSISSDRQSVVRALQEAFRTSQVQQIEAKKRYRLRAILDSMEDGFIVTDSAGVPGLWNAKAARLAQAWESATGQGSELCELKKLVSSVLRTGLVEDTVVKLPSGPQMVATVGPVSGGSKYKGVIVSLREAARVEALGNKIRADLLKRGLVANKRFSDILGTSVIRRRTVAAAEAFAKVEATVLILGESGSGKEVYAQAIHNASCRQDGPYVALNCAALSENLLESELFGYVGGAFTGAAKRGKPGLFEMAHKGTILLDEVSELSPNLQGKLLRVLQERQIRRVGGENVIPVDVRILAASNKDIFGMARRGQFREDLLFRLDVLRLNIPPVRACPQDVECFFYHFLTALSQTMGLSPVKVTPEAMRVLREYSWPGNVREVQNVAQRCLVLYAGQELTCDRVDRLLRPGDRRVAGQRKRRASGRTNLAAADINEALSQAGGSMAGAARLLGIHRTTLWRRLKETSLYAD
jgi:propionate catabolism operon transcriptional regulator